MTGQRPPGLKPLKFWVFNWMLGQIIFHFLAFLQFPPIEYMILELLQKTILWQGWTAFWSDPDGTPEEEEECRKHKLEWVDDIRILNLSLLPFLFSLSPIPFLDVCATAEYMLYGPVRKSASKRGEVLLHIELHLSFHVRSTWLIRLHEQFFNSSFFYVCISHWSWSGIPDYSMRFR